MNTQYKYKLSKSRVLAVSNEIMNTDHTEIEVFPHFYMCFTTSLIKDKIKLFSFRVLSNLTRSKASEMMTTPIHSPLF